MQATPATEQKMLPTIAFGFPGYVCRCPTRGECYPILQCSKAEETDTSYTVKTSWAAKHYKPAEPVCWITEVDEESKPSDAIASFTIVFMGSSEIADDEVWYTGLSCWKTGDSVYNAIRWPCADSKIVPEFYLLNSPTPEGMPKK